MLAFVSDVCGQVALSAEYHNSVLFSEPVKRCPFPRNRRFTAMIHFIGFMSDLTINFLLMVNMIGGIPILPLK